MTVKARLSELAEQVNARLHGDGDLVITAVNTLQNAQAGQISFLSNERYRSQLEETDASAVILQEKLADQCPVKNLLICDNPYLAFARISHFFYQPPAIVPGIHASAIVDKSAEVAKSASIGPLAIIGPNAFIGEGVVVGSSAVIEQGSYIGDHSRVAANATICHQVRIGQHCFIQSGAVIGGDGFGFANDAGKWVKIPQSGTVIIGDHVEVGVNTTIDRGALGDTVIEDGVILDNQIQVAHNVRIGRNTAIAGGTAIAGSTQIGAGCTIGGLSGIIGHLVIADQVHISSMTEVTKSINKPGHYTGNVPAMPHVDWSKNMVRLRQLDELNKRVKALEQKINRQDIET